MKGINIISHGRCCNKQAMHEAILNDKGIKWLLNRKAEMYKMAIPTIVISGGNITRIFSDEFNSIIAEIDEIIECRKQSIINYYER